jgi:endonuclease/exonuclease/phosphatase family metal-dependent hydrolase
MRIAALLLAVVPLLGAETLRVMSFNVRYPSKEDGANRWEHRRDLLVATVREKSPDLLGTQELFYEQGQYIAEKLSGYAWFGVSRRGNREDEHMGVFYKKDRLKLIDSGNFWLSDTPETPGSMSWDVSLPRMVTWGLFDVGGKRFYFYNTHFAHRSQDVEARLRSARLIAERIAKLPPDVPFIMTGDFNSPAGGEPYKVFTETLRDAWTTTDKRSGPEGTFNGFKGVTTGPRIDWILFRGPFRVVEAETVTRNDDGRYPSDHYPVFASFELR